MICCVIGCLYYRLAGACGDNNRQVYVVFGFVSVYAVIGDAMTNLFASVELRIKKRKQKEAEANSVCVTIVSGQLSDCVLCWYWAL